MPQLNSKSTLRDHKIEAVPTQIIKISAKLHEKSVYRGLRIIAKFNIFNIIMT